MLREDQDSSSNGETQPREYRLRRDRPEKETKSDGSIRRRAELWAEQSDRLRALLPSALETIDKALKQGGAEGLKAALALIRMAGLELTPTGATGQEEIEVEAARRKNEMIWRRVSAESPLG